jgi:DNA primase
LQDLKEIKQKIYDDEDIETLLRELGCEYIRREQGGNLITAQLPAKFNSDNRRSVQVKNTPALTSYIRSRGVSGDIYSIVGYCLYEIDNFDDLIDRLGDIKTWVCETLGYTEFLTQNPLKQKQKTEEKQDWLKWLKDLRKKRGANTTNMTENEVIDESILQQYDMYPYYPWIEEGISAKTQIEFQIGFDWWTERIVFPVHNAKGQLIGVKGRYIGQDKYTHDHMKYIYVVKCNKSLELFNWHRALPYIKNKKEVIVFEGAKTVMKAWSNNIRNCVSIEGDHMSPQQVKMLKDLGIETTFVFAWDKDKQKDFIRKQLEPFPPIFNVYYVYDENDLLQEHDSPLDRGVKTWYNLYKTKRKISEVE